MLITSRIDYNHVRTLEGDFNKIVKVLLPQCSKCIVVKR